MAISNEQYEHLAEHLIDTLPRKEIDQIIAGDFSPLKMLIVSELLLNDYNGTVLDIIFEDLFSQKKKPILKGEFSKFADFLMSDLSLYLVKYNISAKLKK